MKRTLRLLAISMLVTSQLLLPAPALAAIVTYDFSANLSAIGFDLLGDGYNNTDPLTGSFSYDDTTVATAVSPGVTDYDNAVTSLGYSDAVASVTGSSTDGDLLVVNASNDVFQVLVFTPPLHDLNGSSGGAATHILDGFLLHLEDTTGVAFPSDALPSSLNLADFDLASISLSFLAADGFTVNSAVYEITALTLHTGQGPGPGPGDGEMPLPPTLALLGIAAVGLLGYRRRR